MVETDLEQAWLQFRNREPVVLERELTIGRSSSNPLVIESDLVSRKHARLQYDENGRYWLLIDLGSTNGTYLNGLRLNAPRILEDGDRIRIGDEYLLFHDPVSRRARADTQSAALDQTQLAIQTAPCWLMLLDVKQSTRLIQQLSTQEYSRLMRQWSRECERLIEAAAGRVNEYLGDGMLAFWKEPRRQMEEIGVLLDELYAFESSSGLQFRVVNHFGEVCFGAGVSSSLEKLSGRELNFIFKSEKSLGRLNKKVLLSEPAADLLESSGPCLEDQGWHEVTGFDGQHRFFALAG